MLVLALMLLGTVAREMVYHTLENNSYVRGHNLVESWPDTECMQVASRLPEYTSGRPPQHPRSGVG